MDLLAACQKQVDKYSGKVPMDRKCDICETVGRLGDGWYDCQACPLNGHSSHGVGCVNSTYIDPRNRRFTEKPKLLKRREWLVKTLNENGMAVV